MPWKIFTDKKASILVRYMISNIHRIIFIVVACVIFLVVINLMANMRVETQELELNALFNRIYYSPNGISFKDLETGRVYNGIIDLDRLDNEPELNKAFNFDNNLYTMAAKIEIFSTDSPDPIKTAIINKNAWTLMHPKMYIKGKGGIYWSKKIMRIMYEENGRFKPGWLWMTILKQK